VAGLLTAICLALPTHNATSDAWYYAACSRWGQELWQPHHLAYNAIGWLWLRLVGASGAAPAGLLALTWLQMLNALAAGASLLVLGRLLWRAGTPTASIPAWLLLVGSSFGMLRFATENETYIQPLLLALLASLAWARAEYAAPVRRRWLLLAGLLAALACLVHQLMVWWWLGLLLGLRPWRGRAHLAAAVCYALPALVVPVAYALAAPAAGVGNTLRFALHAYLTGAARGELGSKALVLTAISLVRTAVQVHGSMQPLLLRWPLLLGSVGLASLALAGYSLLGWRRVRALPPPASENPARAVRRTHALIGVLHLGFATQAAGNAEFMVMLPALAAVALAGGLLLPWPSQRVAALGTALLSWNLAFGLVPAHLLDYTGVGAALRARIAAEPGAWLVLRDPNLVRNQLQYFTGQVASPPRIKGLAGQDSAAFRKWLASRLAAGDTVYTDALGGYRPLDRARLTQGDLAARLLSGWPATRIDSVATFYGPRYLARLGPPVAAASLHSQSKLKASATVKAGTSK
jgi:hypothetical protein